jgi:hypothetical protein
MVLVGRLNFKSPKTKPFVPPAFHKPCRTLLTEHIGLIITNGDNLPSPDHGIVAVVWFDATLSTPAESTDFTA